MCRRPRESDPPPRHSSSSPCSCSARPAAQDRALGGQARTRGQGRHRRPSRASSSTAWARTTRSRGRRHAALGQSEDDRARRGEQGHEPSKGPIRPRSRSGGATRRARTTTAASLGWRCGDARRGVDRRPPALLQPRFRARIAHADRHRRRTALVFDYTNGFHDTANAMATTIATRALQPRLAVDAGRAAQLRRRVHLGLRRRHDRQGHRRADLVTVPIVFAGLVGAIVWNLSHVVLRHPVVVVARARSAASLGAVIAAVGTAAVIWSGIVARSSSPRCSRRSSAGVAYLATRLAYRLHALRAARTPTAASAQPDRDRARSSRSRTGRTTRRRRWASSSLDAGRRRAGRLERRGDPPLGQGDLRRRHRGRHVLGRLARDPHARHRVTTSRPPQGFSAETASSATILVVLLRSRSCGTASRTRSVATSGGSRAEGEAADVSEIASLLERLPLGLAPVRRGKVPDLAAALRGLTSLG